MFSLASCCVKKEERQKKRRDSILRSLHTKGKRVDNGFLGATTCLDDGLCPFVALVTNGSGVEQQQQQRQAGNELAHDWQ